jgi:class 3 adenylate cyclase
MWQTTQLRWESATAVHLALRYLTAAVLLESAARHAELGRIIIKRDGTIEHFSGDGMMILFNTPVPVESHAMQATGKECS